MTVIITPRKITAVLLIVVAFMLLYIQTAHAISTNLVGGVSPMATQISAGGPHPYHNLIMSDHGKVQSVLVGMYWPTGGAKTFTFNVAECDMRPGAHYASNKRFLAVVVNGAVKRYISGADACNGTLAGTTITINSSEIHANFRDSTMYGTKVEMRWVNGSEASACNGGASSCSPIRNYLAGVSSGEGSRIRFRFNPVGANARVGLVDSSNSSTSDTNNSIVFRSGGYKDLYMPFGLSCSITSPRANELASLYDADNGTSTQTTPLYFYVAKLSASGGVTPLSRADYTGNGGGAATSLGDIWISENPSGSRSGVSRPLVSNPSGYPVFTPSNFGNVGGVTSVKIFRVQPQTRYVLVIKNQHAGQFTYIGLPGDALFGSPDFSCASSGGAAAVCTYSLSLHGPTEVDSVKFDADYSASVTTSLTPTSNTTVGAWGPPNGSGVRQRTVTRTDVSYKVVNAKFDSSYTGTPSSQTFGLSDGNFTYNRNHTFSYGPESVADTYTVGGSDGFTYTVQKVTSIYNRTDHKHANGTVTTGSFSLSSQTHSNVNTETIDCTTPNGDIVYAYRPYMDVYGGDIMAGAYQADVNTPGCTQNSSAGIIGWNHNRSEVYNGVTKNDFAGAGAEAGAFALANINSFASALKSGSGVNGPASGLSFANTTGVSGTNYGGNFGSIPLSCNFAADKDSALAISSNYGGDSSYTGQHTYMTSGNVYISGNVVYSNSGGWANTTDIPRFKLLVSGNIYLGPNVTELDGLYVATGEIYTCATGPGSPTSDYDTCNNPLKVYGAFAAKKINFLRTKGTLRDATPGDDYNSDNIGETFIYTPELWLPNEPNSGGPKYDSILGLPPVL